MLKKGFQIDADKILPMVLSANQIQARWKSANQRLSLKHQFENPPKVNDDPIYTDSMYSSSSNYANRYYTRKVLCFTDYIYHILYI